jgi:hypothetical protein
VSLNADPLPDGRTTGDQESPVTVEKLAGTKPKHSSPPRFSPADAHEASRFRTSASGAG